MPGPDGRGPALSVHAPVTADRMKLDEVARERARLCLPNGDCISHLPHDLCLRSNA
jgi:hypothetical protein